MSAKENALIEKAKRVLDEIGLNYDGYSIKIVYAFDKALLEMEPEMANEYSIFFSSKFERGRHDMICVSVDRKTHKLKMVISKYNMYEVPEELS